MPPKLISSMISARQHGFFSRQGGVSTGIYDSLNCGFGSKDSTRNVSLNRNLVAQNMGLPPDNLLTNHQIHSADVVSIGKFGAAHGQKADAIVTNLSNIGLSVLTADCAPVLFCDPTNGIVGAAHAGWKGALGGIIENTIEAMVNIGGSREEISAVIGPCIGPACYEVGAEFRENFVKRDLQNLQYFRSGTQSKFLFNLPEFIMAQLDQANIKRFEWIGGCTYKQPEKYFSYRRSTHKSAPDYGRMISVITNAKET